jgi:dienelactone hydrolase
MPRMDRSEVQIQAGSFPLEGTITTPERSNGLVVFAHGSGSSRHSRRNREVAEYLNERGLATLLFDLLTVEEEEIDAQTSELRFDVNLLGNRLIATVDWLLRQPRLAYMRFGFFGASTGAAAALIAAAQRPRSIRAVVSRGGRPDLAGVALPHVLAPTLLIVGADDEQVVHLNEQAGARLRAVHELQIVHGATHLFQEPGKLDEVAGLAARWFATYLRPDQPPETPDYSNAASRDDRSA